MTKPSPTNPAPADKTAASRTGHSARNATAGLLCQAAVLVLAFLGRKVFLYTLGMDYQGISGWLSNILSILSISELGIGTAVVVSLYGPLASGDQARVRATLRLLRRAYFYVGMAVLALGLLVLPFLPVLVKQQTDLVDLRIVYLLYLTQPVLGYLCYGYKSAIFTADQRQSRVHFLSLIASALITLTQIGVLLIWRNYYAYVGILALSTLLKNLFIARSADRQYAYLKDIAHVQPGEDDEAALPKAERQSIFRNLFGLSLYRISGTVLNTTDKLVLGKFDGFSIIGLYDNYTLVITALTTALTMLFQSFTASVGNLNVTSTPERKSFIFRCLNLMAGWLYGFSSVCLFLLLDPFVALFFQPDYVLTDTRVVPVIVLNFLTSGLLENVIMHKDACGLFWQGRFRPIFSAGLNILLSIWWVTPLGLFGVLLATVVSRLLTTWWFDPWMVHHYALKTSVKGYALQTLGVMVLTAACCLGLKMLFLWLFPAVTWLSFLGMIIICAAVPNVVFYLSFRRSPEFIFLKEQFLRLWQRLRSRGAAA